MGSLSEAYIATNHSGNEVIGICLMKTEGKTHMLIHTATHKPVSVPVRLFFGKTSCTKDFVEMTFYSGNLTGSSCL